ncbi:hypothetical protein DPMN_020446 [Dreissena polymorpha]|uniref:Uncharacterized protein n=1 Tax=Dreissena polymorpha TaxID=45954 RepID=A0A9D4NK97_DREPO|nr:hypothetical protein DPMN_020446 [Dreissena polymorpha]
MIVMKVVVAVTCLSHEYIAHYIREICQTNSMYAILMMMKMVACEIFQTNSLYTIMIMMKTNSLYAIMIVMKVVVAVTCLFHEYIDNYFREICQTNSMYTILMMIKVTNSLYAIVIMMKVVVAVTCLSHEYIANYIPCDLSDQLYICNTDDDKGGVGGDLSFS